MSPMSPEQVFYLPDLGEGLTEAEISTWLVAAGQTVSLNQPLVEVETAKATVEIPSPFAGTVSTLHAGNGEVVEVGSPLVTFSIGLSAARRVAEDPSASGAVGRATPVHQPGHDTASTASAPNTTATEESSGNVLVGYGTRVQSTARRRRAVTPVVPPPPARSDTAVLAPQATPPIRKLAKSLGVDLSAIGLDGVVISRQDVLDAARVKGPIPSHPPAPNSATAPPTGSPAPPDGHTVALKGLRKTIAKNVTRSRHDIPEATAWVEIDATELWTLRHDLSEATGQKVSPLAVVCRAVTAGLLAYPILNSRLDEQSEQITIHDSVNLGLAASTDRGLIVPVIRDAQRLSILQMASALRGITEQARAGTLAPTELTGSTFTLNNYGVLGVDGGNPIINYPEAAILGIGRIVDKPWVHEGAVVASKVTELVLAFDHRICDGREAGGFLRLVADMLEDPRVLLANL